MKYERGFVGRLKKAIKDHPTLIHVVLGPRQVGKTTGVLQYIEPLGERAIYVSADSEIERPSSWLTEQWHLAEASSRCDLLVIDEIQKVHNWSEAVKRLWDEKRRSKSQRSLALVLLGSSSLSIQKGLSESLTGRYLLHPVYHWGFKESREAFNIDLDEFLIYGGYPGAYPFRKNQNEWVHYIRHSLVEPILGRDILSLSRVKSPALFKQSFDLACSYAAQEISYTKLLGQLQEKGNTELIKHYLELFEGAFLLKQLFKFSTKKALSRSSSPKILPLCPALYSVTVDAKLDSEEKGRAFEVIVGSELAKMGVHLSYWREKNAEIDFVLQRGKLIVGVEVKTGKKSLKGLEVFKEKYPSAQIFLITPENFEDVLSQVQNKFTA